MSRKTYKCTLLAQTSKLHCYAKLCLSLNDFSPKNTGQDLHISISQLLNLAFSISGDDSFGEKKKSHCVLQCLQRDVKLKHGR